MASIIKIKKYRRLKRYNQIINVLVRNGFGYLIHKSGVLSVFHKGKNILNKNSYNVLNKFILALSKLYLYDNKIFKLSHDDEESLSFQEYHNDINRYIDDCIYNLSIPSKRMDLIFDELKIGMEISNWTIKVMDFGCTELRFVIDIFKSEGLFIRRPFF